MEYFRSGLKSVLGSPPPDAQITGAETVERLVSRVSTSTLLEDRRDACRALKAMSKKYRVEVGAHGMDVLKQVLELDRADCEIIGYCLDTLCNITSPETLEEEENVILTKKVDVGAQFTEMFIKNPENVSLVLSFLEEYDYRVRWPAVKLLTSLLASKPKEVQDIVLVSPMGVSKLMDLLSESREIIRNDALILLINLTKSNANIQKIVAFENAFDRLFEVITTEGLTDGGIVVEDCLILMLNLLKNNTSNISFFKEGSYIQKITPMLILPDSISETGWTPQKVSNMHCVLQLIRTLVSPNNPVQVIASCQQIMRNCSLFEALCKMLMAGGVPANILTETINTVAEVIRGNLTNQEYFAGVIAPSNPPRPALVVLLLSMVNEKQPFTLRCAVLYCFQSFLCRNEIGQGQIVQSLAPALSNQTEYTPGQLLCAGLLGNDSLSNWFSAVSLSHCLIENAAQKEQLLRVAMSPGIGAQPVSLLHQCASFLQQSSKLQTKMGLLMLLSMWLAQCQQAVQVFLGVPGAMAYLTAQTSASEYDNNEELVQGLCAFVMGLCVAFNDNSIPNYSKENLSQLVEKRVGIETYCKKLNEISRHEFYAKAAKRPQIDATHSSELLLDYEFCKLFKSMEGVIINALGVQRDLSNGTISELNLSEHENALLLQYKDLIRDQDRKLHELQRALSNSQKEKDMLKSEIEELRQANAQLNDHNTLLKAQLSTQASPQNCNEIQEIRIEPSNNAPSNTELAEKLKWTEDELAKVRKDQEDLLELLTDQDGKMNVLKDRLRDLGEDVEDDPDSQEENSDEDM